MKKLLILLALITSPLLAVAGISINIGEPGYYGQIQVDNMGPPQLLYPNPIIIYPTPGVYAAPLYLRVPDYQARHWRHYCGQYSACARPVYFVTDYWYNNTYAPRYRHRDFGPHYRDWDRHRNWDRHRDWDRRHEWNRHNDWDRRHDRSDRHHDRRDDRHHDKRPHNERPVFRGYEK